MRLNPESCHLKFLQAPNLSGGLDAAEYKAAHEMWHHVWSSTLKDFGSNEKIYSDAFTRQDEILSIFHGQACVGMLLLRWMDFTRFNYATDSYFKIWTEIDIAKLTRFGKRIMISSYLTVHPEYRIKHTGVSFRDVILDLMVQRFLPSDMDSISGITRREKHVHTTSYNLGATTIREDLPFHNDEDRVDLLVFYRKDVRLLKDPAIRQWSDDLFSPYRKKVSLKNAA